MIFDSILTERNVPILSFSSLDEFLEKRDVIKDIILKNEYGYLPDKPEHMSTRVISEDSRYAGSKAKKRITEIKLHSGNKTFAFQTTALIPNIEGKIPTFIYISYEKDLYDKYLPCEEIIDNGFALLSFHYTDIASDDANFKGGLASFLGINRRSPSSAGKLILWAYAAMRVMDYAENLDFTDKEAIAVIGHAKLGKAALLAAALDERFKYAVSNCSGVSGAALTRRKSGEGISDITNGSPYLFSPKYARIAADFDKYDFDQNFLLSLISPRKLIIGSAEGDLRSDPESEFLSAYSVSKIYELFGLSGLICDDRIPKAPALLDKGNICYYLRGGDPYLTRQDWQVYMNFVAKTREKKNDL